MSKRRNSSPRWIASGSGVPSFDTVGPVKRTSGRRSGCPGPPARARSPVADRGDGSSRRRRRARATLRRSQPIAIGGGRPAGLDRRHRRVTIPRCLGGDRRLQRRRGCPRSRVRDRRHGPEGDAFSGSFCPPRRTRSMAPSAASQSRRRAAASLAAGSIASSAYGRGAALRSGSEPCEDLDAPEFVGSSITIFCSRRAERRSFSTVSATLRAWSSRPAAAGRSSGLA